MIPITDYEDEYTISECGSITRIETGRVLKPCINPQNGYLYVSLWKDGKGKTLPVHRLVALAYIPNPELKPCVNHKNSNRLDPSKSNLEWCTQAENIQHGYDFGYMSQRKQRKFTDFEIKLLLDSFLSGTTLTQISNDLGCGLSRLSINVRNIAISEGLIQAYESELKRQKIERNSKANLNNRRRVQQFTLEGEYVNEFVSLTAAGNSLGKTSGSISNAVNPHKSQKTAYGYLWKYI